MTDGISEFDAFFRKHVGSVIRFVMRQGFAYSHAEEAVEEAMVTLCVRWDEIEHPLTWVRKTSYWHAMSAIKATTAGSGELTDLDMCRRSELRHLDDDPVIGQESLAQVRHLLDGLTERRRAVLSWWLDGFDDREIARELDITQDTVRSHRRHALKAIARKLQQEGGGQ